MQGRLYQIHDVAKSDTAAIRLIRHSVLQVVSWDGDVPIKHSRQNTYHSDNIKAHMYPSLGLLVF